MYDTKYHGDVDLSKKTFLITGGAGFIGSNLVEYLLKYNAQNVIILDNLSNGHKKNIEPFLSAPNCQFIEGDIRNKETCKQAMLGVDYVLHQAALGSVPRSIYDPITTNQVNINGFLNVLQTAKESKTVERLVYAASSSTYGDSKVLPKVEEVIGKPLSPYAITKYVNELYADIYSTTYNFHTVGLRYFNVFGPRQDPSGDYAAVIPLFFEAALTNKTTYINGDGEQTRDFTFIENVVQANIKAALSQLNKHEVFNVAVGERISINQLWEKISKLVNSEAEVVYRESRVGDVKDSLASVDKAFKILNYKPTVKIDKGLEIAKDWYKRNSNNKK